MTERMTDERQNELNRMYLNAQFDDIGDEVYQYLQAESERAEELEAKLNRECTWTKQAIGTWEEYDSWGTSCGEDFAIIEEWHEKPTPFCSNCGGKVVEKEENAALGE